MPCSYTIHRDKRLVVSTASGVFTFAEGMAHENRLYVDPDFDANFVHLIDATGITRTEITASEISTLARRTGFSPKAHERTSDRRDPPRRRRCEGAHACSNPTGST